VDAAKAQVVAVQVRVAQGQGQSDLLGARPGPDDVALTQARVGVGSPGSH
jgi:hypothetical protein